MKTNLKQRHSARRLARTILTLVGFAVLGGCADLGEDAPSEAPYDDDVAMSSEALSPSCDQPCGPNCRIRCNDSGFPVACECPTPPPACAAICNGTNCDTLCTDTNGSASTCRNEGYCTPPENDLCSAVCTTDCSKPCRGPDGTMTTCGTLGLCPPAPQPRNAHFVTQHVPAHMTPGGHYDVSITVKNTGTFDWSPVGPSCNAFRLGSAGPQDNLKWGVGRAELPAVVRSGQTATISFEVIAPSTPGLYDFQWRMLQECVTWFGPVSHAFVSVGPVPIGTVLYLMGSPGPKMSAGDRAAGNRLAALGYTVVPEYGCSIQDAGTAAQAAAGKALVVIGGTVPANVCAEGMGNAWRPAAVPVLASKSRVYRELSMTHAQADWGWGSFANQTQIQIADPTHPISAGLSGVVTVATQPMPWMAWGRTNENGRFAGIFVNSWGYGSLISYAKGAVMYGQTVAPACRVGAWWSDDNPAYFTANAWRLFDATVGWLSRPECR